MLKSPGFAPASMVMPVKMSGALPKFVRVVDIAALGAPTAVAGNVSALGISVTVGAEAVPLPERGTNCVAGLALSMIVSVAVRVPTTVGVKITERMHEAAAGTGVPSAHVVFGPSAKSPGFAPNIAIEVKFSGAVPKLFTATSIGVAEVLSGVGVNAAASGMGVTVGNCAATFSATVAMDI